MRINTNAAISTWQLLLFTSFASGYNSRFDEHPQEHQVSEVADECYSNLGHALEKAFLSCVVEGLLARQEAAQARGSSDYYPLAPHSYDPWRPVQGQQGGNSEQLKDLLRNYTCDKQDGGSQPIRSMTWEYQPPDPCGNLATGERPPTKFVYKQGFMPQGADLAEVGAGKGALTEAEAQELCEDHLNCAGFTFHSPKGRSPRKRHTMHFKSAATQITRHDEWHTFKRTKAAELDCRDGFRKPPPPTMRLHVDVLRERPPVYIVHDFASARECEYMMNETIPHMAPSVVYGGGDSGKSSSYRQSFSVNMYPDYDDESHVITRVARRKFAFARDFVGYSDVRENEGQVCGAAPLCSYSRLARENEGQGRHASQLAS